MLSNIDPSQTSAWGSLNKHFHSDKPTSIQSLFKEEPSRMDEFCHSLESIYVDFSKHLVSSKTLSLLGKLYAECEVKQAIEAMFSGEKINKTENRSVLHVALRNVSGKKIEVEGQNVMPLVLHQLEKIKKFTSQLHLGQLVGYSGKSIKNIVNIGIGGSDLGPYMVTKALKPYWKPDIKVFFVSNVDASDLLETLEKINPEETLFIIASKTFTTQETMTNAFSARRWLLEHAKDEVFIKNHFVAVSTNTQKVLEFGIAAENMFEFWDWVGGRYSLWSVIGLPIACAVGYANFYQLLAGAELADNHFLTMPFEKNIPAQMAMIGIWYNNFLGSQSHAILAYDHLLGYFARYLQQADMESNGKSVDRTGQKVKYETGPIIWGEPGTNGQHAFYQLIHQGTKLIPADFIAAAKPSHAYEEHQDILLSNFLAQTEALMLGKSADEVRNELSKSGMTSEQIESLLPFKIFSGNKPTTSILLKELNPKNLGTLIALYEHKIFVQGIVWNIYSFDQWGVELGKQLAGSIQKDIKERNSTKHDPSTNALLEKYLDFKKS